MSSLFFSISFQFPFIASLCLSISFHIPSFLLTFLFISNLYPAISFHILSFPFDFLSWPLFAFQFPFTPALCLFLHFLSFPFNLHFNFPSYPLFSFQVIFSLPLGSFEFPLRFLSFPSISSSLCTSVPFRPSEKSLNGLLQRKPSCFLPFYLKFSFS